MSECAVTAERPAWLTAPDPALQAVLQVGTRVSWAGQDGKAATGTVAATSPLRLRVEAVAGCSAGVAGIEYQFSAAAGWPAGLRVVGAEAVLPGLIQTRRAGLQVCRADALALVAALPDASVDLILTDPPYYRVKDEPWDRQWDTPAGFLAWVGDLCDGFRRVLKPNGSLYLFASPDMAGRVECVVRERFKVLNHIVWAKHDGTGAMTGGHSKIAAGDLRAFFPRSERIIFAAPPPAEAVEYLQQETASAGLTHEQLSGLLGFAETSGSIAPRRYLRLDGFAPISEQHYALLQKRTGRFDRPYHDLYRVFQPTQDSPYTDVWEHPTVQGYASKHPCEKPLELLAHCLRVSSRPGAVVLDPLCGSGSTGEAALSLGREFIGGDASEHWSQYAAARLDRQFGALPVGSGRVLKKRRDVPGQRSLLEIEA